jgi:hypothetical protein
LHFIFNFHFAIPIPSLLATRYSLLPLGYPLLIPALDPRKSVQSAQSVFHSVLPISASLRPLPAPAIMLVFGNKNILRNLSMPGDASQLPEPLGTPVVTAAGGSSAGDRVAANLRGFGPLGIVAIIVILAGAEQGAIVGLVFGTIFAVTGRSWMLMCAHAAFDLFALAIIYWNLESAVAHLVFK